MTHGRASTSSVQIHGPVLRHLRTLAGRTIGELARAAGVSTGFLSRVELGVKRGVGDQVFRVLVHELRLGDPRVLAVNPYATNVDQIGATASALTGPTVVPSGCSARVA